MKSKISRRNKRMFELLVFLVKFNILAIPIYIITLLKVQLDVLIDATQSIVLYFLSATGIETSIVGNVISVPIDGGSWGVMINWDCVGWKSIYILFALIWAANMPIKKKIYGLALMPAIYIINVIRIWFIIFYVSTNGIQYFSILHTFIWTWGLMLSVIVLWIIWLGLPIIDKK